ncbi:MAG: hypothetical protein JSS95_03365 [Acidobacteria bacterium]|nr:hypothetical protein [Acidobacteriota bacterium]
MKISSVDVRSLLMRLHDEIQGETGKITAGPMSFAQSLDESLVFDGAPTAGKQNDGTTVAIPIVPMETSASPIAADVSWGAAPKGEVEAPKLSDAPGIQARPSQPSEAKAEDVNAIDADDIRVEKTARRTISLLEDLGGKRETGKSKPEHKREGGSAGVGSDTSSEIKSAVVDQAGQGIHAEAVATDLRPVLQPVQASATGGETLVEASSTGSEEARGPGRHARPQSIEQATKPATVTLEARKGKGIAIDANKADNDKAMSQATAAGDSQQSSIAPVREKPSPKSEDANAGFQTASSAIGVPSVQQSTVAAHALAQAKTSSHVEVLTTVMQDRSASEPPQATLQDHRILNATTSTIEVGVSSGSHGWLKIRAEMTDTGTVKASIAPASVTGQEILHRDLPLLSSFLEQERIPVSSLAVHHPAPSSGIGTALSDGGGSAGQSQGESTENRGKPQGFVEANDMVISEGLIDVRLGDPAIASGIGGSWLSVRA